MVSVVGLRGRYNERAGISSSRDICTRRSKPTTMNELLFPHLADGAGYSTQFILYRASPGQASAGNLRVFEWAAGDIVLQ